MLPCTLTLSVTWSHTCCSVLRAYPPALLAVYPLAVAMLQAPPLPPIGLLPEDLVANCPAGKESVIGPDGKAICALCPKGGYCVGSEFIKCDVGFWTNLTGRNESADCLQCPRDESCTGSNRVCAGVDCTSGKEVIVRSGFFAHSPYSKRAFACTNRKNCLGSEKQRRMGNTTSGKRPDLLYGDRTCAPGHSGILCGRCDDDWYRARRLCLPCSEQRNRESAAINDTAVGMALMIPLFAVLVVTAIFIYLRVWTPRLGARIRERRIGRWMLRADTLMNQHITPQIPLVSGVFKILLSYCQCLGALTRFDRIAWPDLFDKFIDFINIAFNIEIFAILPAECISRSRLGFAYELMATLSLPILAFGGIFILLFGAHLSLRRPRPREALKQAHMYFHSSRNYKLMELTMLVFCARAPEKAR